MSKPQPGKVYEPAQVEPHWYRTWEQRGYFRPSDRAAADPYTIVIPPPNVTGILHMGHVLDNTIQDILVRRARMQGRSTLWLPGTDHASIATEAKVVAQLQDEGIEKQDLGREAFLERAWAWKERYGDTIIEQLKRLGCSCDWQRTTFTLDEDYYAAVMEAFVRLYEEGLIYRGERLINWDPVRQTALSDEEVIHQEVQGQLWHFEYPLKDGSGTISVATTRPETMLGDTAVAVHPDDERYAGRVGQMVILPLVGREIPIIADSAVDPEFGSGAVKVTPAHDPNDWALGERHGLEVVNILEPDGTLNGNVPEPFAGLDREAARKAVVEAMQSAGHLLKVEEHVHNVGHSQRTGAMVEPYLSTQWFLKMESLAEPALQAVESGAIQFYPDRWLKVYRHWMTHIRDWCISRQLWWGHRIPAWYGPDGELFVARTAAEAQALARKHYAEEEVALEQDPDVLDTWFSSWLWPLATLGWPDEDAADLQKFYPTQDLVTGPDIIFFWVARMIMAGLKFRGEVPFSTVYFHGIVRDEKGRRMSKSLGNSPDPLELIDRYGADALRTGIMLIAPQGQDIPFSEKSLELGRNYMNKIWNAARFVHLNLGDRLPPALVDLPAEKLDVTDRWLLSRLSRTLTAVEKAYSRYRLNEVARQTYDFIWADYCDWYLEMVKGRLQGNDNGAREIAQSVAVHVLRQILALLHPFAPFITEELWQRVKSGDEPDLIVAPAPAPDVAWLNEKAEAQVQLLQDTVTAVRSARVEIGISPDQTADLLIRGPAAETGFLEGRHSDLQRLAKVGNLTTGESLEKPPHSATAVVGALELFIPLEGLIDVGIERARLAKQIGELEGRLTAVQNKLANPNFIDRAPAAVVAREKEKQAIYDAGLKKLQANYQALA